MRALVVLVAFTLSGCASLIGTLASPEKDKIFIGARADADLIANGCPGASPCLLPRPIAALDLPLSALFDTVFLLYTVPTRSSE